ncbi:hypothetical protein B0H12DRAFT_1325908 [Mycena haematopus]|nr:hypothetical protein B0H12DRAFT_1325908 [Mycena haematopus]
MATASPLSVCAILERTRHHSKANLERLLEESDVKIVSLEAQIAALVELRDRECDVVAALKYLLSPIYTVPVEILAEIFERAIDDDTHIKDVFRVSQVCSDWRQAAHRTPRLWTGPMSVNLENKRVRTESTDALMAWLARSAALPVCITVTSTMMESADIYHGLLEQVLRTASRWRSLRLDVPDYTLPLITRRLVERRLDSLEELDLGNIPFAEPLDDIIPSFTNVPRLRKLSMSINSSLPILVPWANLAELTLHNCDSPDIALNVLALCANLMRVSVCTVGWRALPHIQDTLALSHLHTLSLALIGDEEDFMPFFSNLSVPALRELCLGFGEMTTSEHWTETHFTTFQLQAPNITRLELQYAGLTSGQFRAAIRHAPSLTHLKLYRCPGFDDTVINALRYEDGVTPLVPHLRNFVLRGPVYWYDITDDILAGMIATRWWTDAELASRSVPPAVARWTRVEVWHDLTRHVLLGGIPSDVLRTSTR